MPEVTQKNGPEAADHAAGRRVTATPPVDVLETENEFLLVADLPGVKPDEVDVRFEKGELIVHGQRTASHPGKDAAHREHETSSYHRVFAVAETIAADKITADLKNGVLTVRLPKVEAAKPKRITVSG